jgi:hypothetical protein
MSTEERLTALEIKQAVMDGYASQNSVLTYAPADSYTRLEAALRGSMPVGSISGEGWVYSIAQDWAVDIPPPVTMTELYDIVV